MEGKRAAIFDVDRTLIKGSTERIFIRYLLKKRVLRPKELVETFTSAIRLNKTYTGPLKRNKLYLKGKAVDSIKALAESCFKEEILPYLSPTAVELIEFHKRRHDLTVLLTGSLELLTEPLQVYLGVDRLIATRLGRVNGVFTGTIEGLHPYGINKLELIRGLAKKEGILLNESYAYGDRYADRMVLNAVGYPVAVNPDPFLWLLAKRKGWRIIHI